MRLHQKTLYEQLRAEAVATREKLAALLKPLDSARLNEHPEPQGWSVAQVLEHLCVADERNTPLVQDVLVTAPHDASAMTREWKSSFIGGMIAGALLKPKPLKAPKVFDPGLTPRNGVVEDFLARELKFLKAFDDATSYDWRAIRVRSAALPKWAPKMNLGDGFRIRTVHTTRHSRQIERLVQKL